MCKMSHSHVTHDSFTHENRVGDRELENFLHPTRQRELRSSGVRELSVSHESWGVGELSSTPPNQAPVPGCRHSSDVLIIHVCLTYDLTLTPLNPPGVAESPPFTLTTSLDIPIPSSYSSNRHSN